VPNLTPDEVRSEVTRFWNIFTAKAPELLEEFYAPDATVFASTGIRTEPGRLAVARRRREYFDKQTSVRVQVGMIDVQPINDHCAVASYTFRFDAIRIGGGAKASDEHLSHGRATQLFIVDAEGKLRILHEHLSAPVNE
jgi:ketosteroid isomerase-like protein